MTANHSATRLITSYIDGHFVEGRPGAHLLEIVNPATEELLGHLQEADAEEVDAAVDAATRTFERGDWHGLPTAARVAVLRRIAELTERHARELCELECADLGIPITQARGMVTDRVIRNFNFYADHLGQAAERAVRLDDLYQRYVHRDPAGVCALISPWNAPLMLATSKLAPALAFGNSCVLKTSEYTPLALARFAELLSEAGVPAGVVNFVNGRGHVTGSHLVEHPRVDLVSFTGGGPTGVLVAASAARGLKKYDLELGGKSAAIISDSSDLDRAIDGTLLGIFSNSGQMCFGNSRILVHRKISDQFIENFVARAGRIRVGDPTDEKTEMGPVAFKAHYERVLAFCAQSADEGVSLLCGGTRTAGRDVGFFIDPTVMLARSNSARICQEEVFGPVATIQIYDEFEEAIATANDTRFGLAGYVWSNRLDEGLLAGRAMRAGTVMINSPMVFDLRMPFGGYRQSGVGREGIETLRNFYSEEKSVAIALRPLPMPISLGKAE